jgi:nucleoside-diphosphate-sugar epimerase
MMAGNPLRPQLEAAHLSIPRPELILSEGMLNEVLTTPGPELVASVKSLEGPLLVLGAGGKMGPTLCVQALRALRAAGNPGDVIAVSRFSTSSAQGWLEKNGVRTLACDLLDPIALKRLPSAANVIYLVGRKFGTRSDPAATWLTNAVLPARIAQHFVGSRMVALSTGNVYPLVPVDGPGSKETDPLTPLGEYSMSCVARERIFSHFSRLHGNPVALIRLSYALDLRYGVLVDIASQVLRGKPVDVTTGYLNCIWQGDANEMIIRSIGLASSPARAINLTGTTRLSVRRAARRFGRLLGRPVQISGVESETAYLSDMSATVALLGPPQTPLDTVFRWTAHWIARGGPLLSKPTHFSVRDGRF